MQVPARPPAAAAMAGATIDKLSGGRFIFGLGPSGPQVSEGWYGVPYAKPWGRTREYIEVVREIIAREGPVNHQGEHYTLPLPGGEGKPLKLNFHPLRNEIPVFGGMGSRKTNFYVDLAHRFGFGEVADEVQQRFQDGDRAGAFEAMPDEIVEATSLVGTEAEVAERIERFRGAGIDRLICSPVHVERSQQEHTLERLATLAGVSA